MALKRNAVSSSQASLYERYLQLAYKIQYLEDMIFQADELYAKGLAHRKGTSPAYEIYRAEMNSSQIINGSLKNVGIANDVSIPVSNAQWPHWLSVTSAHQSPEYAQAHGQDLAVYSPLLKLIDSARTLEAIATCETELSAHESRYTSIEQRVLPLVSHIPMYSEHVRRLNLVYQERNILPSLFLEVPKEASNEKKRKRWFFM